MGFNYCYAPHNTKVRELIENKVVGDMTQIHLNWLLNTHHGSDFFRRWHQIKENNSSFLLSKSIYHFDLAIFWVRSEPGLIFALGDLGVYRPENAKKKGIKTYRRTYKTNNAKMEPFALHLDKSS